MSHPMNEPENLPKTVGRYEIKHLLGAGAMGSVFLAEDPRIKRKLAIKVVKLDAIKSEADRKEFLARFQREAEVSGVLNDPAIVTIYDVGDSDMGPFLAMEYVAGHPLDAIIKSPDLMTMPMKAKLQIACGIASALDHAHSHGIVHRDVKPGNVMITEDGRPKLMDFGIAKREDASLTQTGTFLGTPSYASPEQIKEGHATGLSDIFSFGVVVFELLSGQLPFPGTSINTILYRIVNEPPSEIKPPVMGLLPEAWHRVFSKVLAKNPAERYTSCSAFVRDLLEASLELDKDSRTELLGQLRQAGALTLTAAASAGAENDETQISARMRTRHSRTPIILAAVGALAVLGVGGAYLFRSGGGEPVALPKGVVAVKDGKALSPNKPLLLKPGEKVVFQAKGFRPVEYTHVAGNRSPQINLEALITEVHLQTEPAGAKVVINGDERNTATPCRVLWNQSKPNQLSFFHEAEKKGLQLDFQVGEYPKDTEIFKLVPSDVPLTTGVPATIDATAPVPVRFAGEFAVRVKVDGKDRGEVRQLELPPGQTFKLDLSNAQFGFKDSRSITTTPGKPMSVSLPPLLHLKVETFPTSGTILVNGVSTGIESDGDTAIRVVKGRHKISIQGKSGGKDVDVREDHQQERFPIR